MKNIALCALLMLLSTALPAFARFSQFVCISPDTPDPQSKIQPVITFTSPERVTIQVPLIEGTRQYWLIVCKESLNAEEQNFRSIVQTLKGSARPPQKKREDVVLIAPLTAARGETSEAAEKTNSTSVTIQMSLELAERSYIYVDYPHVVMDGGYFWSVDIPSFVKRSACSNKTKLENDSEQEGHAALRKTSDSKIIRTEDSLTSLLASIEGGETAKNITLVGTLEIGDNPKTAPSKLVIGETSVLFGHDVDKEKHHGQTVLVKGDIRHADGKTWDAQVVGHMIVNVKRVEITQHEAIRRHILAIRTDPSVKAKRAASEALAKIGLPSLAPLMDYLRQVAQAKPNDAIWISPGYIREALSAVCKRVGEDAEKALLERFLEVTNETERDCLFRSLAEGSSYTKALARVLGHVRNAGTLDDNADWAIRQTVHFYVYGGGGRDESAVSDVLGVFAKQPTLQERFEDIERQVTILKSVGVPNPKTAFTPRLDTPLAIAVDEQTEFSVALPRPDGPWSYHWGFGEGVEAFSSRSLKTHGLCYLGRTLGTNTVYFRFIGSRALETPLNVYVQGGVPDGDPAEYQMRLTVRSLPPQERQKRILQLRASLDDRKRQYVEDMESVEQDKSSVRGKPRR
jgi:hypothetical protein